MPNPSGAPTRTVPGEREVGAADLACDRQRLALHGLRLGQQPLALLGQRVTLRARARTAWSSARASKAEMRRDTVVWSASSWRAATVRRPVAGDSKEEAQVVPVECSSRCIIHIGVFAQCCARFHP